MNTTVVPRGEFHITMLICRLECFQQRSYRILLKICEHDWIAFPCYLKAGTGIDSWTVSMNLVLEADEVKK